MPAKTRWTPEDSELSQLSEELDRALTVERALFSADMTGRVMMALPRSTLPLVHLARALTGAILLSAVGCVGLAIALVSAETGLTEMLTTMKVALGLGIVVMAVLLAFAAPRLAAWDCRLVTRLTGRLVRPQPLDLVLLRTEALLLLAVAGLTMM